MAQKVFLALTVFFLFFLNPAKPDHLFGGEITWECLPSGNPNAGKFIFQMKIYRDCNGIPGPFGTQALSSNAPGANSIQMFFVDTNDVSPVCENNPNEPHLTCAGTFTGGTDTGAVQEFIHRSDPVTINGVPPVGG